MTEDEQTEFWRKHRESKKRIDEEFTKLPYGKKLEIIAKMEEAHEAMRSAKKITLTTQNTFQPTRIGL